MDSAENDCMLEPERVEVCANATETTEIVSRGPYAGQHYWHVTNAQGASTSWRTVYLRDSLGDMVRRDVRMEDLWEVGEI